MTAARMKQRPSSFFAPLTYLEQRTTRTERGRSGVCEPIGGADEVGPGGVGQHRLLGTAAVAPGDGWRTLVSFGDL